MLDEEDLNLPFIRRAIFDRLDENLANLTKVILEKVVVYLRSEVRLEDWFQAEEHALLQLKEVRDLFSQVAEVLWERRIQCINEAGTELHYQSGVVLDLDNSHQNTREP
jgi:hypothetical protein